MTLIKPIHPFPARMAPEVALAATMELPPSSLVLDPMTGSGTVVRFASEQGHQAIGFDMDPLAVLMSRVWTTPICTKRLREAAETVVRRALDFKSDTTDLPWIDNDPETSNFINYWFGAEQQADLRRLSSILVNARGPSVEAMMLALSRIIITKQRGASLAWDVSHSRPHKKLDVNTFPVMPEFIKSVNFIATRLDAQPPAGTVRVNVADARNLHAVQDGSIDAVLTSPSYLNAIDYLRGHKFTLIWLGYRLCELRFTRAASIGSERNLDEHANAAIARDLCNSIPAIDELPSSKVGMVRRYVLDLYGMVSEIHRVLKPGSKAVLVIGNSCIKGVFVENSRAAVAAANRAGLRLLTHRERDLPTSKRYLPPPTDQEQSILSKRMRTESVLTFIKP